MTTVPPESAGRPESPESAGRTESPESAGRTVPPESAWRAALDLVDALRPDATILLVCHVNPDGDALGSMLGVALGLRRRGFSRVVATFPGPPEVPEPFCFLPGLDLLVPEESAAALEPALVLTFDAASVSRLGALAERVDERTIVLDHHASNTGFGGVHLVDPAAAATSVLAEELLRRLDVPLEKDIATCLYVALATDTGSFRFDLTTPRVHELAARLLATGISAGEISRRVFDTRPFGAVRLFADVVGRAELDRTAAHGLGLVWTYATLDDLSRYGQRPYVLEALIDSIRCAEEADVACVIKQTAPDEWAVSMRSKGGVDLSRVAVALGGGGHRLAAGFTGRGSATDVVSAIRRELDAP